MAVLVLAENAKNDETCASNLKIISQPSFAKRCHGVTPSLMQGSAVCRPYNEISDAILEQLKSWHRSKPFQRCKHKITGLCKLCTISPYNFGVFDDSGITQTLFLERSAIMPFSRFPLQVRADSRIAFEFALMALIGRGPGAT